MNQGKLPIEQKLVFDESTTYDFHPNAFKIGGKRSKGNIKYYATIISNIDIYNMNFRVKFSKSPDFYGKQDSWINSKEFLKP